MNKQIIISLKAISAVFVALLFVAVSLLFVGCNKENESKTAPEKALEAVGTQVPESEIDPGVKVTVTLDANGGSVTPTSISVVKGRSIEEAGSVKALPTPTRSDDWKYMGWYTSKTGEAGTYVNAKTKINVDITFYAVWKYVAQGVDESGYFNLTGNTLTGLTQAGKNQENLTIPDNVTIIDNKAFYKCRNLKSVTIPASVREIRDEAFSHCDNLTTVTFDFINESALGLIGEYAFYYTKISSFTVPNRVTYIGSMVFAPYQNSTLTTLTFKKQTGWKHCWQDDNGGKVSKTLTSADLNATYFKENNGEAEFFENGN